MHLQIFFGRVALRHTLGQKICSIRKMLSRSAMVLSGGLGPFFAAEFPDTVRKTAPDPPAKSSQIDRSIRGRCTFRDGEYAERPLDRAESTDASERIVRVDQGF